MSRHVGSGVQPAALDLVVAVDKENRQGDEAAERETQQQLEEQPGRAAGELRKRARDGGFHVPAPHSCRRQEARRGVGGSE